jgi:hypothetical protein
LPSNIYYLSKIPDIASAMTKFKASAYRSRVRDQQRSEILSRACLAQLSRNTSCSRPVGEKSHADELLFIYLELLIRLKGPSETGALNDEEESQREILGSMSMTGTSLVIPRIERTNLGILEQTKSFRESKLKVEPKVLLLEAHIELCVVPSVEFQEAVCFERKEDESSSLRRVS